MINIGQNIYEDAVYWKYGNRKDQAIGAIDQEFKGNLANDFVKCYWKIFTDVCRNLVSSSEHSTGLGPA